MEAEKFPHIEVMPVVDRVVSAGLWIGRLFTKRHFSNVIDLYDQSSWTPVQQDAAQWMDKFDLQDDVDHGWTGHDNAA